MNQKANKLHYKVTNPPYPTQKAGAGGSATPAGSPSHPGTNRDAKPELNGGDGIGETEAQQGGTLPGGESGEGGSVPPAGSLPSERCKKQHQR